MAGERDRDPQQMADADSDQAAADGEAALAGAIPEASEPLKGSVLMSMGELVNKGIARLTNGDVAARKLAPVEGQVDRVPPDIGSRVVMFATMVEQLKGEYPELEPYAFDPTELLASNAGCQEIGSIVDAASRDEDLVMALKGPGSGKKPKAAADDAEPAPPADAGELEE